MKGHKRRRAKKTAVIQQGEMFVKEIQSIFFEKQDYVLIELAFWLF